MRHPIPIGYCGMKSGPVVVFGGTGFVGRRVVSALADAGVAVTVASRHPQTEAGHSVTSVFADVTDRASVERAVENAMAIVNCVALYVETGGVTFEDVHVAGARNVARVAVERGLANLVHFSGIGSDPHSPSPYVEARGRGEEVVRQVFPSATIFRPSVMFGRGDAFLSGIAGIVGRTPVVPLFGSGRTRLQPVHVDDVAAAVRNAVSACESNGRMYELGGPEILSYRQVVERVMEWTGRRRLLQPVPYAAWKAVAGVAGLLPKPPITEGQVALMMHDNIVKDGALGLQELGVSPTPMTDVAPGYIGNREV